MKILIISLEVWRNDQNGGNTLTNMFSRFSDNTELAQVYCYSGMPDNDVCDRYFNITTNMVADALMGKCSRADVGHEFLLSDIRCNDKQTVDNAEVDSIGGVSGGVNNTDAASKDEKSGWEGKLRRAAKKITNNDALRDIIWKSGYFKSDKLKKYITDFAPDIIYAPGYGVGFMNYLIQWVASFTDCPIVALISDDYYSMRQMRINPLYWISHLFFRRNFRKTVQKYSLIYTMTDNQKSQLEKDFDVPVKIIRKGAVFPDRNIGPGDAKEMLRVVYAGNMYMNRWKTLKSLADAIETTEHYHLDIYSNGATDNKLKRIFDAYGNSTLHDAISYSEVMSEYEKADIALHVESFDIINRTKVQMSFSTKIVDCISSGCAVMCICDKNQSGLKYLRDTNMAICIDDPNKIGETLQYIYTHQDELYAIRRNAYSVGKQEHDINIVSHMLHDDFKGMILKEMDRRNICSDLISR